MSTEMGEFSDILVRRGKISAEQLEDAKKVSRSSGKPLEESLVQLEYATSEEVSRAVAEEHGHEFFNVHDQMIPESVIELVPESVARENAVLPICQEDDALRVAISDPQDFETLEKLQFILNRPVRISIAPRENIMEAINRYYGQTEGESADSMIQEFTDTAIDFTETEGDGVSSDESVDQNSAPIVRLVHMMISEALQLGASDIHIEPFEDQIRIRYRIDGVLHKRDSPPRRLLGAIISRVKILASMDIAERRRPQDGRIKVTLGEKDLDLRVSVIPTNHGQSVVMRLLDKDNISVTVKKLGMAEDTYRQFLSLIKRPNGIILVTGPTGSGKTTTLYAALNALNRPDKKIITAEDPVEYYLPGINQTEVKHDIGLDFARIIKAMLRQAPNIILVGEMRDQETASMGIQASLTGHLVFSTLHTNDAPGAITRMIDMGVPGYLVASSVVAVLAQRLVRTVCKKCKQPDTPSSVDLRAAGITEEMEAGATFMRGKGCATCQKSGYKGRLGVCEMMMLTGKIREMIFENKSAVEIRKVAIEQGMRTIYSDAIRKVLNGTTTLEEIYRVAKRSEQDQVVI